MIELKVDSIQFSHFKRFLPVFLAFINCNEVLVFNMQMHNIYTKTAKELPEFLLLKFCHYPTITATSGPPPWISHFFHAVLFLYGPHLFLQLGCFLCRFHFFL